MVRFDCNRPAPAPAAWGISPRFGVTGRQRRRPRRWHSACLPQGVGRARVAGELRERQTLATESKPYVIVVGVDYSEASELALLQAFQLAGRMPRGEVHPVHVAPLRLPPLASAGSEGAAERP